MEEKDEKIIIEQKEKKKIKFWSLCPIWCLVIYCITVCTFILMVIYKNNEALSDFVNKIFGNSVRFVLTQISNIIPFSIAELLLLSSPILIVLIFFIINKIVNRPGIDVRLTYVKILAVVLALLCIFLSINWLVFLPSFSGSTIDKKFGFDRSDVTPQELYDTGVIILDNINKDLDEIMYPMDTYSSMNMTYSELNEELNKAWNNVYDKYHVLQKMPSRVKPVLLSYLWTYTHISGVYFPLASEANLNINYPDFIVVSSAAHEMSHQRGVGREDEANFCAFIVCIESDNPYLRYSGYMDVLGDIMNSLSGADPTLYNKLVGQMDERIIGEFNAYSKFFDKYRKNVAATVSNAVNDTAIKIRGQETGAKSYGLVVDLVCAYYKDEVNNGK